MRFFDMAALNGFGHDVKVSRNWFEHIKSVIIMDEGAGKNKENARNLLKTFLTITNQTFVMDLKKERIDYIRRKRLIPTLIKILCHLY